VPGILFVGGKDLEFRTNTIAGLFAVNRRGGALWALAEEPGAAHIVGRSRDVALMFYEDVLPMRLTENRPGTGEVALTPLVERTGFLGDYETKTFEEQGERDAPNHPTAWRAMVTDKPFAE
jgi:hypothetical protein